MLTRTSVVLVGIAAALLWSRPSEACGCFAPTTTVSPVVQAGERILFGVRNGKVIAHVQIQYAGDAKSFGWLLPLPSVPTLKVGTDELFDVLLEKTTPIYTTQGNATCRPITFGCSASALNRGFTDGAQDAGTGPAVDVGSVGPYEYAVLSAADKTEMLRWLNDNRFFIPTGTQDAVDPYIAPGAYFLALKLKSDASSGDITPIVLEYESSYPMIPLQLTAVGATPNMGVQVWLLGEGRGIPRNFQHAVINDAVLEWENGVPNYADVVTRAVSEAPNKHAFVTEYAGPSSMMKDAIASPNRFGNETALAATTSPAEFIAFIRSRDFTREGSGIPEQVQKIVLADIPVPPALGVSGAEFVARIDYYLGEYRTQNPDEFVGYTYTFDAPKLARLVFENYVTPIREANALFDEWPKLTRLFTTLSPEDMTADPVFAFSDSMADVPLTHTAQQEFGCNGFREVTTEQGWKYQPGKLPSGLPAALRLEALTEQGDVQVTKDNLPAIRAKVPLVGKLAQQGCSTADPLTLLGIAALFALRRRRG